VDGPSMCAVRVRQRSLLGGPDKVPFSRSPAQLFAFAYRQLRYRRRIGSATPTATRLERRYVLDSPMNELIVEDRYA